MNNNILLEKQGVPNGAKAIAHLIANDIVNIIQLSDSLSVLKNNYHLYDLNLKSYNYLDYTKYNATYTLNKHGNLNHPYSSDSTINVRWTEYDNDIISDKEYNKMFDLSGKYDNFNATLTIKQYIPNDIVFNLDIDILYSETTNKNFEHVLCNIIMHELTHGVNKNIFYQEKNKEIIKSIENEFLNKKITKKEKEDKIQQLTFDSNYNTIKGLMRFGGLTGNIAKLFYITSILDERNSYVAQFYSEYQKTKNIKETQLYKNINELINELEKIKSTEENSIDNIMRIYNNFKYPAKYFLNLSYNLEPAKWFNRFKYGILKNYNDMYKKMIKTITLDECLIRERETNFRF